MKTIPTRSIWLAVWHDTTSLEPGWIVSVEDDNGLCETLQITDSRESAIAFALGASAAQGLTVDIQS